MQRFRPKSIEGSAGYLWRDPIYRIYRIYRVAVGERTTKAINYRHRSGPLPKSIFAAPI